MGKYCCFCCPQADYSDRQLDDLCPTCGLPYGFPLEQAPTRVGNYRVIEPLDRGFYAATYVVEQGALNIRRVLKITPRDVYRVFPGKNFERECRRHLEVSQGSEHIVDILDMFDEDVVFGSRRVACHIAALEHVDGELLSSYVRPGKPLSAKTVAQLAIDLFRICDELRKRQVNHNDLHDGNIIVERLRADARRANAIDGSIRAVAIDLGSVADTSKSDSMGGRLGDLQWIAEHIDGLVGNLLRDPDVVSDYDHRLASLLNAIAQSITPRTENQRTPDPGDFIRQIEDAVFRVTEHWSPWREPLRLRAFDASYNAQTLNAWHVPQLLVDPDEQWLNRICSPGPQVITGMRGCGKTMLLRALQFHARAARRQSESEEEVVARLRTDKYVGLFVSAQRLLDRLGGTPSTVESAFARLFVTYGLESVRAVIHLRDVDAGAVSGWAYRDLASAISNCLTTSADLEAYSEFELERRLTELSIALSRGDHDGALAVHPNEAFNTLAEAVQSCSPIWHGAPVLFLLDDVSTRYLHGSRIDELLSNLLFQSPCCAFKLTSEGQTIELGLKSPGRNHPARVGRDLSVFDLGAEVYEKIKAPGRGNGRDFVERILEQRAQYFATHPGISPSKLLGEVRLEAIAHEIGDTGASSRERKGIYRGMSALCGVCVGDIGDAISLYELILRSNTANVGPVGREVQSECFQDFCARRLYDLNRRGGYLKNVAKSFAEASNALLMRSVREPVEAGRKRRIRQYLSIYVRVTTGNMDKQIDRLRELIDAGVFVFAGGVPRSKTRDGNPMQQFKLTYRKIYGIANFIGLAERDRFELSGRDLEAWLEHPEVGREILLRNLGGEGDWGGADEEPGSGAESVAEVGAGENVGEGGVGDRGGHGQILMFGRAEEGGVAGSGGAEEEVGPEVQADRMPVVEHVEVEELGSAGLDAVIVGLGFEERSLESIRRVVKFVRPDRAVTIAYREVGMRREMESLIAERVGDAEVVDYDQILTGGLGETSGRVLVDVTGLAKPVIFHSIRNELRHKRCVWVCHTEAEEYYPLEEDLERVFQKSENEVVLESLHGVLTGEEGPYECHGLLRYGADDTRQRVICAFASPKHERLLALLDEREYDRVEIVAPKSRTHRSRVAQIAGSVAARNSANSEVTNVESNDLEGVVRWLGSRYRLWCVEGGRNFELGLTGSKLQAVACAAASATFKVAQCWYLQPKRFDPLRFTKGVGRTQVYRLSLPGGGEVEGGAGQ